MGHAPRVALCFADYVSKTMQAVGNVQERKGGVSTLKRILLALMVAAVLSAVVATAAGAQTSWYWCQDYYGNWVYCYY